MFFQPIGRKVRFDASNETREKQRSKFYIIQNVDSLQALLQLVTSFSDLNPIAQTL